MIYNKKYYNNLLKKHYSTAKLINTIRWNFVKELKLKTVLDYGCGCNFLTKYAPRGITVDSYDIGKLNDKSYPQTGIQHEDYDLIFFNDVLEHVDWENNPDKDILNIIERTKYVYITIPIYKGENIKEWVHYKPGEHLTYFTEKSLDNFMLKYNFKLIKKGWVECPPRKDILTGVYKYE